MGIAAVGLDSRLTTKPIPQNTVMSMHGNTIRMLESANFTTPQAVAIADAIDAGIRSSDLVTVPVLDSRLAQLELRLFWKMLGVGLTTAGIVIGVLRALR